jgi:hypothetical protein
VLFLLGPFSKFPHGLNFPPAFITKPFKVFVLFCHRTTVDGATFTLEISFHITALSIELFKPTWTVFAFYAADPSHR